MSLRVLLTNADSILLSMYQAFLVDQRMTIRTASTALQCLEVLREWRPDVLILDEDLPWGSGLGVLAVMREDATAPVVPVLLLASASGSEEAFAVHDCTLLIKPVSTTLLANAIRALADSAMMAASDSLRPGCSPGALRGNGKTREW